MSPIIKPVHMVALTITVLIAPAQAREQLDEGAKFVDVAGGDPANPAILDSKGDFTAKLLRDAENTGIIENQGKSWIWAKLKPELHRKEQVCEAGRAEIYKTGSGNLIVKYARYFEARLESSGELSCSDKDRLDYSLAPTLDHYLTGIWAVQALKRPILQSYGTIKDPFCQPQFVEPCPTREEVEDLLDTAGRPSTKSCKPDLPDCLVARVTFIKRRNGSVVGGQSVYFTVKFTRDKDGSKKLKDYSFDIPPPPMLGPPGPPRILGNADIPQ
jgi:hypothetical protein